MKPVSDKTLARLQAYQADTMDDVCNIVRVLHTTGTQSQSVISGVACGLYYGDGTQGQDLGSVLDGSQLVLRLPLSQPIYITDRVEVVTVRGTPASGTYQVASYPQVNSSVQKVNLRAVRVRT